MLPNKLYSVMGKALLVCSVYAGVPEDQGWLRVQRHFLQKTCPEFDHVIYLGHRADRTDYGDALIVGQCEAGHEKEHLFGLHQLVAYCKVNEYDGYLVLDSDAFP